MSAKEFGVLLVLGAIWGASFMFIKVGGEEIEPFALVEMRLGIAGLIMLLISMTRRGVLPAMLANWRPLVIMGLINCALPYTLLTWGEIYISSGLAAIYNATAPLWAAGLALVLPVLLRIQVERLSARRAVGLVVGLAGVVLVVSANLGGGEGGMMHLLGQGACLVMALSYGLAGIYGRKALKGVPLQAAATGQLVTGAIMILPLAAMQVPEEVPSAQALSAVITLSVVGTALASLMYYWLLARVGATKVLLVTYLLPAFALMWGALFLSEAITLLAVIGLALILSGIAITSGSGMGLVTRFWSRSKRIPV